MNRTLRVDRAGIGRNHDCIFSTAVASAHSGMPAQRSIQRIVSTFMLVTFAPLEFCCTIGCGTYSSRSLMIVLDYRVAMKNISSSGDPDLGMA